MTGINRTSALAACLVVLAAFTNVAVTAAEKEAGKTLLTRGEVTSNRVGRNVTLKRRSKVFEKDEIRVGKDGRAQFRMVDQALISLQENSVLQIKKYQFTEGGSTNSALLELLSGGLRTITGAIGKGNKKAYELRTPLATIGIRGTDYEVEIVSNGMYVAVWDGVIHLRAHLRNGCNILLGRSKPFMFIFIDHLGKCTGLNEVPDVFREGHSSNINIPESNNLLASSYVTGKLLLASPAAINPTIEVLANNQPPLAVNPVVTYDVNAFAIDQSRPSTELDAKASALNTATPTFKVGLNLLDNAAGGVVQNFQQSVGGYAVSWGYWGEFDSTLASRNVDNSTNRGLLWATYEASDPSVVSARTGSFSRYENISDSLLSASAGTANNLQVQMDINFESGAVSNGALSANTPNETWVAVFDGQITSGDLDLQMNGASVIDSDPNTPSPARDASGFIAGDFIGDNAEAILGAFGLSEDANPDNNIEGVFIVEEQ